MNERYVKNYPTLSVEESNKLKGHTVCIIGCGGIGGYVIEMLARIGFGRLIVVDYDKFEQSNLNRQLLSTEENIGQHKAIEAKQRLKSINQFVVIDEIIDKFTDKNGGKFIKEADVVVDALDTIESRLMLEKVCEEEKKILIHGAISDWFGQVTTVFPGDKTLTAIYKDKKDISKAFGNPSFTPALIASLQVSEVVKCLMNRGKKLLLVDMLNHHYDVIDI